MAKFYGNVGFAVIKEPSKGVSVEEVRLCKYYGDVIRDRRQLTASGGALDDVVVANLISIVADTYAFENFHAIRFVEWMGVQWKVLSADVQRPRITLTLGGVYNAEQA